MVWRYSPQTVILRDKKWSSAGMIHIELHSSTELSDNIMVEVFFSSGVLIFSTFFSWHRVHSALSQPNTSLAKLYKLPERWDEQLTRLGITTEWQSSFYTAALGSEGFFFARRFSECIKCSFMHRKIHYLFQGYHRAVNHNRMSCGLPSKWHLEIIFSKAFFDNVREIAHIW